MFKFIFSKMTQTNLVRNCIPFGLLQTETIFGRRYKFQNVAIETSKTFGITNVQVQVFPFCQGRRKKIILEIIMFYLEMR